MSHQTIQLHFRGASLKALTRSGLTALAAWPFLSLAIAFSQPLAPGSGPAGAVRPPVDAPLKLLFSGPQDVVGAWGKLHFGVTPVRLIRECEPPAFTVVGCFPLPDGRWDVFG